MELNLADLFESVSDATPERVAVACGARRLTYRQLDERSTRLAHGLASLGVAPGEHVGLCMRNTIEHIESMLACYKLRAVPININWRYEASELAYVLEDADAVVVIHDAEFAERVGTASETVAAVRDLVEAGGARYSMLAAEGAAQRDLGPRSAADHYLLYTGGTTGRPKGVVWRHDDIFFAAIGGGNPGGPPIGRCEELATNVRTNTAQRVRPFLPPDDPGPSQFVALSLGPLMHASGQWGALGTLLGGGTLVLDPSTHLDVEHALDLVEREQVCMLTLIGDTAGRPLVAAIEHEPHRWDLSSLRLIGSGGTMLSADTKRRLISTIPSLLAILEGIGSSESPAHGVAVTTRTERSVASLTFASKAETILVDDELRPIAPGSGVVGRLATRGHVPIAYYKDPERTARTFVRIDGERYAVPGDYATVDHDGTIHLVGRGSSCINSGGEKVFAEEVEAELLTHPGVADVVVVGAPDIEYGATVCAIVQPSASPPSLDDLRAHCRGRLAGYKLPRALVIVDRVERTPAGKPDYAWARMVAASK